MDRIPCVYLLAIRRNGTLYTGVTARLPQRVWEHRPNVVDGFTGRYGVHRLVYYETAESASSAITREKKIKAGSRRKKLALIERFNPEWRDLYPEIV